MSVVSFLSVTYCMYFSIVWRKDGFDPKIGADVMIDLMWNEDVDVIIGPFGSDSKYRILNEYSRTFSFYLKYHEHKCYKIYIIRVK